MVLTYFDDAKFNKLIIIAFPCAHLGQTSMHLVDLVWPTSTLYWCWGGHPAVGVIDPLQLVRNVLESSPIDSPSSSWYRWALVCKNIFVGRIPRSRSQCRCQYCLVVVLYWCWGCDPAVGWLTPYNLLGMCWNHHQSIRHHRIGLGELWFAQKIWTVSFPLTIFTVLAPVQYRCTGAHLYHAHGIPCTWHPMHDHNHLQPCQICLVYICHHMTLFYDLIPYAVVHSWSYGLHRPQGGHIDNDMSPRYVDMCC